jgi:hypothetical protein
MRNFDEEIKIVQNKFNILLVEKFIAELTFEHINLVYGVCGNTLKKTTYASMYVNVPQNTLKKERAKINMVRIHIGKADKVKLMLTNIAFRNELVNKMKKKIMELYLENYLVIQL